MASVKSDRGRLLLGFSVKGVRYREYLGLDDTKEGRAQAKQIRIQVEAEIINQTLDYVKWMRFFPRSKRAAQVFPPPPPALVPAPPPTFATFAREWLTNQKTFVSNAHHLDRLSLFNTHLVPFFGPDKLVASITVEDIERLIGHMKQQPGLKDEKISNVRVNKARDLLSRILNRAVKHGWLPENPVLDVNRLREDRAQLDPLSWEEVRLLLEKGFKEQPTMHAFYTVAIFTGLRTSEQIALKWSDLDFTGDTPVAVVRRSHTRADGEHMTKTAGSVRAVDLRPQVEKVLKDQRAETRLKSEYVFCNAIGGALDRDNLMNRVWYPALKRAGVRERNPYQTRHTFATLALSAGEEIGWVAKQLGHTNTEMVIRHYYRWIRNNTRMDGSALDKAAAEVGL